MAKRLKVYPGDLSPIPTGPKAEQTQERRYRNLYRFFGLRASKPVPTMNEAKALLLCLTRRHTPEREIKLRQEISSMDAVELSKQLDEFVEKYLPGLQRDIPHGEAGRPRREARFQIQNLIMYNRIKQKKQDNYHWNGAKTVKDISEEDPYLKIDNCDVSVQNILSRYRQDDAIVNEIQRKRNENFEDRKSKFESNFSASTKAKIEHCRELINRLNHANEEEKSLLYAEMKQIIEEIILGPRWEELNKQLKQAVNAGDQKEIESIKTKMENFIPCPSESDGTGFLELYLSTEQEWKMRGEDMRQILRSEFIKDTLSI